MQERAVQALREAAAEFVSRESNRTSLITVTRVVLDERRGKGAEIYVSVFPIEQTHAATDFLNRKRNDFREFIKKRIRLKGIPRVTFLAEPNLHIEDTPTA